jgi:hypothetical protein
VIQELITERFADDSDDSDLGTFAGNADRPLTAHPPFGRELITVRFADDSDLDTCAD